MATTEDTRKQLEKIDANRRAAVEAMTFAFRDNGNVSDRQLAEALQAAGMAICNAWRAEAISLEDSTKRGAKGMRERLRTSAEDLAGFVGGLVSPTFLESLDTTDDQPAPRVSPELADLPVMVHQRGGGENGSLRPATEEESAATLAYLKGETNVLPLPQQPDPQPALTFIDPAPIGPERMSWDRFVELVNELPPRDHGSFSMVSDMADCGVKWAFDCMARRDLVAKPVPAWYLVGGIAFHKATETIERVHMLGGARPHLEALWADMLANAIGEAAEESGVQDTTTWRASDKGRENFDWWRVQGLEMLKRYVAHHDEEWRETHQIFVMPDGRPALELALTLDLDGWPFECVIDQVWKTPTGLFIDDLKSGKSKPPSTFQLGGYAHALNQEAIKSGYAMMNPIAGAFYDARAGSHDMEVDNLLTRHPLTEITYRANAARVQAEQKAFLPRVSNFGGGCTSCAHRAICPAQS